MTFNPMHTQSSRILLVPISLPFLSPPPSRIAFNNPNLSPSIMQSNLALSNSESVTYIETHQGGGDDYF